MHGTFGPVAPKLYQRYKDYGKYDISLTEEDIKEGNDISDEKKDVMDKLYNTFKDFSAMELVSFTHADDCPWKKAWTEKPYSKISKKDMKEWFKKYLEE